MSENQMPTLAATPTAEDWEARRAQISQLYQDKTLKEVMKVVNGPNGFRATPKMFKARITKWGLDKKNKEHEARAILRLHAQRGGKPTHMRLRGRSVDINRIEHYFKRKATSIADVMNSETEPVSDLVCKTPPAGASPTLGPGTMMPAHPPSFRAFEEQTYPESIRIAPRLNPRGIRSPDSFSSVENLLALMREYVSGSFKTGIWVSLSVEYGCISRRGTNYQHIDELSSRLLDASFLFAEGRPFLAGELLSEGFAYVKSLVETQHPNFLPRILTLISRFIMRNQNQVAMILCKHIYKMADALNGEKDPFTHMFKQIFSRLAFQIGDGEPNEFLLVSTQSLIDVFRIVLGPSHYEICCMTENLSLIRIDGSHAAEGSLSILARLLEEQPDRDSRQTLRIELSMVEIQVFCGEFEAAEFSALEIIEKAKRRMQSSRSELGIMELCHSHRLAAKAQGFQHKYLLAEANYRRALAIGQDRWGIDDFTVIQDRTILWRMLLRQNKVHEANELASQGPLDRTAEIE